MQEFIVTISTFFKKASKSNIDDQRCNAKKNDPVTVATWYIQDLNAFRDLKCFSCSNSERWQSLFLKKTLAASLSFDSRMCSHYAKKIVLRESNFFGKTQCLVVSSLFIYKSLVPYRISVQYCQRMVNNSFKMQAYEHSFYFYAEATQNIFLLRALSSLFIITFHVPLKLQTILRAIAFSTTNIIPFNRQMLVFQSHIRQNCFYI